MSNICWSHQFKGKFCLSFGGLRNSLNILRRCCTNTVHVLMENECLVLNSTKFKLCLLEAASLILRMATD